METLLAQTNSSASPLTIPSQLVQILSDPDPKNDGTKTAIIQTLSSIVASKPSLLQDVYII